MVSDEVRMLLNRMRSNPEEFVDPNPRGFRADTIRASVGKWDTLMSSLIGNKPDLEFMFDPEEIEALRACAKELIQPKIRATIVKQIVGGDEEQRQMEMEYSHPYNTSNTEKLQKARVQLIKQFLEKQSQE
jgi:hypothetical protein